MYWKTDMKHYEESMQDVAVKYLAWNIDTHWKLLALSSGPANFTGGTTFGVPLLCHRVLVQYCALTLWKNTQRSV